MIIRPHINHHTRVCPAPAGHPGPLDPSCGGFKIGVTRWARANTNIETIWQRNYYEHIIRNEDELCRIREYIIHNPAGWATDAENPNRKDNRRSGAS